MSGIEISAGSPGWIKPSDVMHTRKLKARRNALKERMNTSLPLQISVTRKDDTPFKNSMKRKNPFHSFRSRDKNVKFKIDSSDDSTDNSLFNFLQQKPYATSTICQTSYLENFHEENEISVNEKQLKSKSLIVDWSLKSKLRLYSSKPIPWKHNFKTSEEASGTTGFVRCLNWEAPSPMHTIDTSSNAQFYQNCLLWQHPSLPFLNLFPRDKDKVGGQTGVIGSDPKFSSALHADWCVSLRSLFQLLRVRQCAFFYVCASSFTCLFRAAGVAGVNVGHALVVPTTRGLREAIRKEGIEFEMPLYNTTAKSEEGGDEDESESNWLETLGVEAADLPSLTQNRVKAETEKLIGVDGCLTSLVCIKDMELQGLLNFLLNSSSCATPGGPLGGVPPTLLAPVAFQGGTLKALKVNGGPVQLSDGNVQYSLELRGPILPTTVINLATQASNALDSYVILLQCNQSSLPFTAISSDDIGASMPMAFAAEGLVDCGLPESTRNSICKPLQPKDTSQQQSLPKSYKEITYEHQMFTWTDS